jgi:hypothetical protein
LETYQALERTRVEEVVKEVVHDGGGNDLDECAAMVSVSLSEEEAASVAVSTSASDRRGDVDKHERTVWQF